MPKRSSDESTVLTGNSSLRNLNYEPSLQGSVDDGTVLSDGQSAMSSVLSSVKRNLRGKGGSYSTQSCSTRQSEGIMWQDTETEGELYSTSTTDEELDDFSQSNKSTRKASPGKPIGNEGKPRLHDIESMESTEESTAASTTSEVRSCPSTGSGEAFSSKSSTTRSSRVSKNSNKTKATTASNQEEGLKRLTFSTEALGLAAKSRIHETRHTLRPKSIPAEELHYGRLEHVDYYDVADLEVATNNQDISTLHPLGKEECVEVFNNRVPFVVPISQASSDDLSSIHALSTKVPVAPSSPIPDTEGTSRKMESDDIEKGPIPIPIPDERYEEPSLAQHHAAVATPASTSTTRSRLGAFVAGRSDTEIFFTTLIGISLVTLIVLLILLFVI